jgi:hypothetical protein
MAAEARRVREGRHTPHAKTPIGVLRSHIEKHPSQIENHRQFSWTIISRGNELLALVQLYKALGGGWKL